ncbi:monosaccharide ABC transporter substrate-binding protein (CUT2 family) [Jejuia pallidilutea]|uniref:histidine kinase n=1 Tax=Jejuia pallidilutea TaxID=504487 RepID=A0A362XFA9_9FLAO|nr:substrate-binding domain-containing protein [Jejuia pallidilutea]PQV50540.1 monosaccharide ABC transporter substrate-binding protein (CUT2 family) [Jejuia pallidilutea]
MIKKNVLLFIVLALCFLSCTKQNTEKHKVGFSQCISKDDYRKAMDYEMMVEASLHPELELTIFQANGDIEAQKSHIQFMINNDFDVIIISPAQSDPLVEIIETAFNKGIPIIIVDRKINTDKYTAFVGADNMEVGRNAGYFIASSSTNNANVLEIRGSGNAFPKMGRHLGFHEVVDNEPNIKVPYSFDVEDFERVSQILDSIHKTPIDYVYAFNDNIAYDAWKVAKEKGVEKRINFIGVDGLSGLDNGIQLVQKGILAATILYPTGGDEAIKIAMKILQDETVLKENILNTTVIDYRNAKIMEKQYERINKHQIDIEKQQNVIRELENTYSTQSNILKWLAGLLIISILLAAYSIFSQYKLNKKKRTLELQNKKITVQRNQIKSIAKEVKKSNEAKTNFFTGLSHEFKTPITLILSSVESMFENKAIKETKLSRDVALIYNNSKRLLRLINQLLDFRKIEDRKFILKASEVNLYEFSNHIFKDFEREAEKRNINFSLHANNKDLKIYLDRDLIDKVYFNLLSNAFKFTPNNGTISMNIVDNPEKDTVNIHFKDSGIGIPNKELNSVFKAFYQGSNNNQSSSGIGLFLSKEFVELHKGALNVHSKHGTEFIVTLHKGSDHLKSEEIIYEPDMVDDSLIRYTDDVDYHEGNFTETETKDNEEHYSILIIEDNLDLVTYLKGKLAADYLVYTSDGTDAIDKALEHIPDIIVCDVNLPEKSGFDICKTLKNDLRTSHIPTIILTAQSSKESYIQGLQSGADLYLTKPFSYAILLQSIKSLLYNREKLRYYYVNNIYRLDNSEDNFGPFEQNFISNINELINNNLDNSNFSVEQLADELNISRIQLYRKMKAISGISISDYIQNIRLEKAKVLLNETTLTISEVAYATGFSSPSYFSTSFKNKYSKTPKAYRSNK